MRGGALSFATQGGAGSVETLGGVEVNNIDGLFGQCDFGRDTREARLQPGHVVRTGRARGTYKVGG